MINLSKRINETVNGAIALYNPNGPIAIIAFFVLLAVAIALWYRYYKEGKPRVKYMRPVNIGCTFMAFGYIARFSRRNGISAWPWLFETLFILLSPCAFLAEIDILLPKMAVEMGAEDCILLNLRAFKICFILMDVVCVLAQLAGTALTITFGDLVSIGQKLVTAGLWVQLVSFLLTVAVYGIFGYRISKRKSGGWKGLHTSPTLTSVTTLYFAMGLSCVFMLIRSCYRVAEYTAGAGSSLAHSEGAFYILDTLPMLLFAIIYLVVWPPRVFEQSMVTRDISMVSHTEVRMTEPLRRHV